jgi:hypothetical protein
VTQYTHGAKVVLLDSSVFFYFCQGGQIINLAAYLGKARVRAVTSLTCSGLSSRLRR